MLNFDPRRKISWQFNGFENWIWYIEYYWTFVL